MKTFIAFLFVVVGAQASAEKVGPAGCGLGYQLFHKENQVLAATTNASTYTQLFGITSGTSGCEGPNGHAKLDTYVEGNRVALGNDMARGEGETLAGISEILNCQDVGTVTTVLKANYQDVFPQADVSAKEISQNIKSVLQSNNVLCSAG